MTKRITLKDKLKEAEILGICIHKIIKDEGYISELCPEGCEGYGFYDNGDMLEVCEEYCKVVKK